MMLEHEQMGVIAIRV